MTGAFFIACYNDIYLYGVNMKLIYFATNGRVTNEDRVKAFDLESSGYKIYFSNGSVTYGFQDSCDAVYLSADFPHIESWAVSKGVKVMKPEPVAVVPETEKEVKTNAKTLSDAEGQEEKTEEELKPRRGRRKAVDADQSPT